MKRMFLALLLPLLGGLAMAQPPTPTPTPIPGAIPAETFSKKDGETGRPISWFRDNTRQVKFWRDFAGLLMCDDPDCFLCRGHVYGADDGPVYPIRRGE